jgi:hypothetical protein
MYLEILTHVAERSMQQTETIFAALVYVLFEEEMQYFTDDFSL